jgi:hypothetical protein|tara:strand:- start:389 stop:1018 length:630 start_codon:yes stop_codon:yes gene_type:complete
MVKKRRPITQLPDDIRQIAEVARSNAAARIVYGLQSDGPWWSGHFAQSWKISTSPVKPTKDKTRERKDQQLPSQFNDRKNNNEIQCSPPSSKAQRTTGGAGTPMEVIDYPGKTGRLPGLPNVPPVGLGNDVYIGNEAKYAGFAVNRPNAKMPDIQGNPVTYEEHGKEHKLSSRDRNPNWYKVYTEHNQFLKTDITKGFLSAGFKTDKQS